MHDLAPEPAVLLVGVGVADGHSRNLQVETLQQLLHKGSDVGIPKATSPALTLPQSVQ